jgi:type IV pilus assembly protein PilB
LSGFTPDAVTLSLIPSGLARLHGVLPVGASGNTIFVALADPLNSHPLEDIRFALGREIVQVVSFPPLVRKLIREHYGSEYPASRISSPNSAATISLSKRG